MCPACSQLPLSSHKNHRIRAPAVACLIRPLAATPTYFLPLSHRPHCTSAHAGQRPCPCTPAPVLALSPARAPTTGSVQLLGTRSCGSRTVSRFRSKRHFLRKALQEHHLAVPPPTPSLQLDLPSSRGMFLLSICSAAA